MLHFPDPTKLKTRKILFEEHFAALDCGTLEQLKELSSKRRAIEETVNSTSSITEAIAREMSGGLTSHHEQYLQKLKQYLPLLENLVFHADMAGSNSLMARWISNLRIQWSSALASSSPLLNLMGPKYFQVDNIRFELGMILFLYAAILRERAFEVMAEDLVQSATLFREAAGVYQYLSHDVLPSLQSATSVQRPLEATSSLNHAMNLICLAEAQAVTIKRAEEKKTTVGLLGKLHYGASEFLDEATSLLQTGTREHKDISARLLAYISSCKAMHELRSRKYLAEELKSTGQIGVAIGVLHEAVISTNKKLPEEESWKLALKREVDDAAETLRKFENENEFVWHEKIASGDQLPMPRGSKIVNAIPYHPIKYEKQLIFKF